MKLYYAPTSPFARKVRIAIRELGMGAQVEEIVTDPWTSVELRRLNPLAKVPTFADGETVLYESGVICEYLDAKGREPRLFPAAGPGRWRSLLLQGLADGAATAAGRLFADERRPENERSDAMMARFRAAIAASIDQLESDPPEEAGEAFTIGGISVAAFLAYLDFRWPGHAWRDGHGRLAAWFAGVEQRPSLRGTAYCLPPS